MRHHMYRFPIEVWQPSYRQNNLQVTYSYNIVMFIQRTLFILRRPKHLLHIPVRTGGIFFFPWHRHQIEGTDRFYCLLRKSGGKQNCQSSEAKRFSASGIRTIDHPVASRRQSNALTHSATPPPVVVAVHLVDRPVTARCRQRGEEGEVILFSKQPIVGLTVSVSGGSKQWTFSETMDFFRQS